MSSLSTYHEPSRGAAHPMSRIEEEIKAQALELGFDMAGIAAAGPLDEEGSRLGEWLARGYHGTMRWMAARESERRDPRALVPGAASVISVAMNYYAAEPPGDPDGARPTAETGKISRYAWGDDYHDVMGPRLSALLEYVRRRIPGTEGKWYVDTGPVLEKAWAARAGIGWEGKHTNVITREMGSWVFLGEVIVTARLEPDAPAADHCGSCTACIDACPTGAIVEPYLLDGSRCISYLTIEHRGDFAAEFEGRLDGWIYGCDICQEVCPWNRKFARPSGRGEFAPRPENLRPALAAVASLGEEE